MTNGYIRPELIRFAEAMERTLRANDHKGSTEHGADPHYMLEKVWEETRELDREMYGHPNIWTSDAKFRRVQHEAVDVANCAMLLWLGMGHFQRENKARDLKEHSV